MSATSPKSMFGRQDTVDSMRSTTSSENADLCDPQSFNTNRATVKRLARRIVLNKSSEQKTEFKETVWEASILLGVPGTGSVGSVFIAVGLSANLLVQFVFCLLLRQIIKEPFPKESVEGFMRWRLTLGHSWSNVDQDTRVSLVSRLCNRDPSLALSEKQDTMLEWMEDYLGDFFGATTGCTLVMLTIIIWALIVFKELWEAFHFAQAIANLPKGVTRFVPTQDDQLRLVAIGNKRFAFMMAVSVARICIALALLVLGSNLLAFTAELQEVVLNAVALAFVMECDELIFANFIPLSTKVILRSLVPLSRQMRVYRGVDATPAANIIAILAFASFVLGYWVLPMMHTMRLGKYQLCGGNLDFAVAEQGATGMIVSTNTSRYVSGSERLGHASTTWTDLTNDWTVSNWVVAVHELARYHPPTMSLFQSSQRLFENRVSQTMEQMTENVVLCEDWDFEGDMELLPFLLTLQNATKKTNASQCKDFASWCREEEAMLLRHACPVTCGCRSPRSGLLLNGQRFGCPREVCHGSEEYLLALDEVSSCDDYTPEELTLDAGWRDFVEQLAAVLSFTGAHDTFEPDTLMLLADAPAALERLGCDALAPRTPIRETFCGEQHHSYASLHAFCPKACGCQSSSFTGCPQACRWGDEPEFRLSLGRSRAEPQRGTVLSAWR